MRVILGTALVLSLLGSGATAHEYALDDGAGNWSIGPSQWDAELLWGNYFDAVPGAEMITSISVSFGGSVPLDRQFTAVLFEDPTDDLDPTDAIPLAQATGITIDTDPNEFITVDIPDTQVSGGFFVAGMMFLAQHEIGPRMDPDNNWGRSWLFFDSDINLDDLGSSPLYYNMADTPFNGTWMTRAQAIPEPATGSLLLMVGVFLGWRRR